ncbi:PrgI family protein [Bifidobacterium merycicum]|uniref:PrgI family protein n=2 Tax=Bifidobacterium merycicum TaxID=78345 RepID=UPI000529DB5D|nr:PrgI family protein [Bifidobacterium merycicum]SHE48182.1 PrgI family protein [Bifidobacterium merycicum DSM 6492]
MLSVTVHKDIGEYTEKVVGKLSARTLACTAGGLAASVGAAAAVHLGLGVEVADATLPVMAASMPFWLMGFWRPKGLKAEEYVPMRLSHALSDGVLAYETGGGLMAAVLPDERPKADRRARRAAKRKGAEIAEPSRQEGEE